MGDKLLVVGERQLGTFKIPAKPKTFSHKIKGQNTQFSRALKCFAVHINSELEKLLGELRHCPCALCRKVSIIHKAFLGNLRHQIFN